MVENEHGQIELHQVSRQFQTSYGNSIDALQDVSFIAHPGEFVVLIGPSGCGKTTLLRLIAGLEKTTHGSVIVDGETICGTSYKRGFIFQNPELFKWMTVEKNVAFGLRARSAYKERKDDVQKYIDMVGLSGFEKVYPHHLSGGMSQRVSLARALINHPNVLLLDEPFGSLDAFTRTAMQKELMQIWEQSGTTMLMVTHDIDEAIYLSDRIIVMTPHPGEVKVILNNDLPRPRAREMPAFEKLRGELLGALEF